MAEAIDILASAKSAISFQVWQFANTPIKADIIMTGAGCTTLEACLGSIPSIT